MKKNKMLLFYILFSVMLLYACGKDQNPVAQTNNDSNRDTLNLTPPPETWQEHWFEHDQLVKRVYYDNKVAVYFDKDMSSTVKWPFKYFGDVWTYVRTVYGDFGDDPRLFVIFHNGRYSGGHPSTYFDASHDYRNMIDVGPGPWTSGKGNDLDLPTHEIGHIVEGASKGFHGSPAFTIWGDSKWMEIFIYDVYNGLNMKSDAARWYNMMMQGTDDFPRANTHWFKDWFYPIYSTYGGNKALNNFFDLLGKYFPKKGKDYARDMNWGEFVHFWSGAAGVNLKELATNAFGWSQEWDAEFRQAKKDYPDIIYQ